MWRDHIFSHKNKGTKRVAQGQAEGWTKFEKKVGVSNIGNALIK